MWLLPSSCHGPGNDDIRGNSLTTMLKFGNSLVYAYIGTGVEESFEMDGCAVIGRKDVMHVLGPAATPYQAAKSDEAANKYAPATRHANLA